MSYKQYSDPQIKKQLNDLNYDWFCINSNSGRDRTGNRLVKLKHKISKEIIKCRYYHAKKNNVRFPKYENMMIKKQLNDLNHDWICVDSGIAKGNETRLVKLKHKISKEIIKCYYQCAQRNAVRFPKYEKMAIKKSLNNLNYDWICTDTYTINGIRLVKIQQKISKEIRVIDYSSAIRNTVRFPKYENLKKEKKVNQLGLKANPQYKCVSSNCGRKNCNTLVKIKRTDGFGKVVKIRIDSLSKGCNPFNETQNRVEVNVVQPMYEKEFRKNNIPFIKEYFLGRKRIDYLLFPKTLRIGLEVKQSNKHHYSGKNQIGKYKQLGSLKQYKLSKVLLSDPQGIHPNSLSINKIISLLKKKAFNEIRDIL